MRRTGGGESGLGAQRSVEALDALVALVELRATGSGGSAEAQVESAAVLARNPFRNANRCEHRPRRPRRQLTQLGSKRGLDLRNTLLMRARGVAEAAFRASGALRLAWGVHYGGRSMRIAQEAVKIVAVARRVPLS